MPICGGCQHTKRANRCLTLKQVTDVDGVVATLAVVLLELLLLVLAVHLGFVGLVGAAPRCLLLLLQVLLL